jgi:hypothetical protein
VGRKERLWVYTFVRGFAPHGKRKYLDFFTLLKSDEDDFSVNIYSWSEVNLLFLAFGETKEFYVCGYFSVTPRKVHNQDIFA